MDVFKVLAAILHLGNVQITAVGNERSSVSVSGLLVPPCLFGGSSIEHLRLPLLLLFSTRHVGPPGEASLIGRGKQGFPWVVFKE